MIWAPTTTPQKTTVTIANNTKKTYTLARAAWDGVSLSTDIDGCH
jgi:hypothetical protein